MRKLRQVVRINVANYLTLLGKVGKGEIPLSLLYEC